MSNSKEEKFNIDNLLSSLDKKYGKGSVMKLGAKPDMDLEVISSGSLNLDRALGVGGYPKGRIVEIYGAESSGKAQPLSSNILTPFGWVKMGDVKMGQIISTPDGKTSTVIGIYPQGVQDVYEIKFDDKTTVRCTLDHLWLTYGRKSKLGDVLSTKEILEKGLTSKQNTRSFKIPTIDCCYYPPNDNLKIDPYLLGVLLGNGSFKSGSVKFSTIDVEILENISEILKYNYTNLEISDKFGKCDYNIKNKNTKTRPLINYLKKDLEEYDLFGKYSYEKFIPKDYLISDKTQRLKLLQGLIDSDGYVGEDGTISYSTTSKILSENFEELCRSLGMRVTTSSRITKYKKQNGIEVDGRVSYRSSLLFGNEILEVSNLSRKKDRLPKNLSDYRFRFIESIEKVGREEVQCIMIGHPDHLYITDNYTPTHNTTLSMHAIAECQQTGGTAAFIDAEHSFDKVYAENLGIDTNELLFVQPNFGEEALEIVDDLVKSNAVDIIVVDSVASLVPKSELEGEMGDSVTFDTPIYIRNKITKLVEIVPIASLYGGSKKFYGKRYVNTYLKNKTLEVLTHNGWKNLEAVFFKRNIKNKSILITSTKDGYVKTTKDHCLFVNGEEKTPEEMNVGDFLDNVPYPKTTSKNYYNEPLAFLMGAWVGDGAIVGKDTKSLNNFFEYYTTEESLALDIKTKLETNVEVLVKINKKEPEGNRKILYTVRSSSDSVIQSFLNKNYCNKTNLKKVPKWVLNGSDNLKQAFLDGFFLADGSHHSTKYSKKYYNNSLPVISGIQFLLKSLGKNTYITFSQNRYNQLTLSETNKNFDENNKVTRIIDTENSPEYLYDICTSEGTFVTSLGDIVLHNSSMGLHARLMSQAMRKLAPNISKSNCLVIFINQTRSKIGVMFGNPETTTGGNALKFYASVRLQVYGTTVIKNGEDSVGKLTKVKVIKNKVAPPLTTAEFEIEYGKGISKVGEIIDLGVELDIIQKKGSWYSYGDIKLGQGKEAVKSLILDNEELFEELEMKITNYKE